MSLRNCDIQGLMAGTALALFVFTLPVHGIWYAIGVSLTAAALIPVITYIFRLTK